MSDRPLGPGWWEASDDRWYPPEQHPAAAGQPPQYEPPQDYSQPGRSTAPPCGSTPGGGAGPYPQPRSGRSAGRIVAIVFSVIFLLVVAGCGAFVFVFRDLLGDSLIDFSDAVYVDDPATCRVVGVDFAEDYEIEADLTATSAVVNSHYELTFALRADNRTLGQDWTVFRDMEPGEFRTEEVFNTIDATVPFGSVDCEVVALLRTDA